MNPFEVTVFFAFYEFVISRDLMKDALPIYLMGGTLAGVNGLIFGNPFDVIRTT